MKKKFQFLWLFAVTFIGKHKKFVAVGSLFGFFATLFFLQAYPLYSRLTGTKHKTIAIIGRFTQKNLPLSIQRQISVGLTSLLPSGEPVGALALRWEVDPSGKTYTFFLRSNIFWQDGTKFKASDIDYKIKDAQISTPNDTTIQITLKEPYAPLPTILSLPLIKPNLVGLGMYRLSKIKYTGDFISELSLNPQIPDLPHLTYKFYPNVDDAILAFKLGEVNVLQNISDPQVFF